MHFTIKFLTPFLMAIVFITSLTYAASSTSDSTNTQVGITGGSLLLTPPQQTSDFGSYTLNGASIGISSDVSKLIVGDATGTGEGWSVGVQATSFKDEVGNTFSANSMILSSIGSISAVGGTTSAIPSVSGGPWTIDSGSQSKILTAAAGEGIGTYEVTFPLGALALNIIASTEIDGSDNNSLYESTITWTITKSP